MKTLTKATAYSVMILSVLILGIGLIGMYRSEWDRQAEIGDRLNEQSLQRIERDAERVLKRAINIGTNE